jgi:hypothetical protein
VVNYGECLSQVGCYTHSELQRVVHSAPRQSFEHAPPATVDALLLKFSLSTSSRLPVRPGLRWREESEEDSETAALVRLGPRC